MGIVTAASGVPLASVLLGPGDAGFAFTLHRSDSSLQEVHPIQGSFTDPVSGATVNGWGLTFLVAQGESFWLTRDRDGATSEWGFMDTQSVLLRLVARLSAHRQWPHLHLPDRPAAHE